MLSLVCMAVTVGCSGNRLSGQLPVLEGADIVILGEVHDNAAHHRNQAQLLARVGPAAVVFEMLSPEQAEVVNRTDDRGSALGQALDWDNSGWPDWTLYQPVFEALGSAAVYGMAVPGATVNRAVTEGAAAVFGVGADRFGLVQKLPAEQQAAREAHQQAVHCNMLPPKLLPGMVQAQRLRDAAFARTALQALADTGGPVVVITGSGHARSDWGMPAVLRVAAPEVAVASVGQLEEAPTTAAPFDGWLVADPAPREDPCEAFAAQREADTKQ